MSNCWLVAMWIWALGHCRQYVWMRRSHSFRGLLPHFGVAERMGWRQLRIIEYVPPKSQLWTRKNCLLVFEGHYRVWHVRVEAVRRWATKEQALADHYFRGVFQAEKLCKIGKPTPINQGSPGGSNYKNTAAID